MTERCDVSPWEFGRFGWWLAHIGLVLLAMWAGAKLATRCQFEVKGNEEAQESQ